MYLYVPSHTQIISLSRDKIQSIWTFQIQLDLVDRSVANRISRDAVLQERKGNDHCSFPIARQRRKAIAKNPSHKPLCNQSCIRGVTIWTTLQNNNRWPGPICDERASPIAERIFVLSSLLLHSPACRCSSREPRQFPTQSCGHKIRGRPICEHSVGESITNPDYIEGV